jgi:tetratricopeptide (TPR) repeat protein
MPRLWLCLLASFPLILSAPPSRAEDSPEWTACVAHPGPQATDDAIVSACTTVLDAAKEPRNRLADAAFSRALAEQRKGNQDKADGDFAAAMRFDPKFTKVYLEHGLRAVGAGKYDAAIKEFNQAIAIDPKLALAYFGRGLAYDASREFDRAIKDHQQAISINPNYAEAYFGLGLAYHDKGQNDRAIDAYTKAIALEPQYTQALYDRGNAYGALNKIDLAIADYSEAIRIDPQYAKAYYMRGLANEQSGKADQALADLDAAVRINPDLADAAQRRNELQRKLGQAAPQDPANKQKEDALFGLYLAKSGDAVCHYTDIDDDERTALDREVTTRIADGVQPGRAEAIEAHAKDVVAQRTQANTKLCADAEFAADVRNLFDATADRPKRQ